MFVNPWVMVLGAAAAFLPVLIHWLTRPRPVVRPLSTVRFVRQAVQQRRSRRRLRDFVILAARTAAVLLLAAAIARPLSGRQPRSHAEAPGLTTRVVLLDVSQSMAARTKGIWAIDRARPVAAAHLTFQTGLAASLLLAGATTRSAFDRPSARFAALRTELGKAGPRPERLDIQAALTTAAQILAQAGSGGGNVPTRRRELVILSDFQRTQWTTADFSGFPRDTAIQLESTSTAETPPNLAVLQVSGSGRAEVGRPLVIEVHVGNFSTAALPVEVELALESAHWFQPQVNLEMIALPRASSGSTRIGLTMTPWQRPICSCSITQADSPKCCSSRWAAGSGAAVRASTSPASRPMRGP